MSNCACHCDIANKRVRLFFCVAIHIKQRNTSTEKIASIDITAHCEQVLRSNTICDQAAVFPCFNDLQNYQL